MVLDDRILDGYLAADVLVDGGAADGLELRGLAELFAGEGDGTLCAVDDDVAAAGDGVGDVVGQTDGDGELPVGRADGSLLGLGCLCGHGDDDGDGQHDGSDCSHNAGCFWIMGEARRVLLHTDLFKQAVGMSPAVHHIEHVAHVDADAACQAGVEVDVAGERVPVAVEGETDEASLSVEHG